MAEVLDAPQTVPIISTIRSSRTSGMGAASRGGSASPNSRQSMYSDEQGSSGGQVSPNWLNFFNGVSFAAFNPVDNIDPGTITSTLIANNAITTPKLAAGAVIASKIAAGTITATEIAANSITADRLSVASLDAISANLGHITAGDIVLPSGGFIRSGQTAYDTGVGFYLGNNAGTPKFSIGDSAGSSLTWDGTDLTITGDVVASDITGGTITGATFMTAGSGSNRVTIDSTNGLQLIDSGNTTRVQLNAAVYAGLLLNGIRSIDTNDVFMESQSQNVQIFASQSAARASFAIGGASRGYFDANDGNGAGDQPTSLTCRVNGAVQRINRRGVDGVLYI